MTESFTRTISFNPTKSLKKIGEKNPQKTEAEGVKSRARVAQQGQGLGGHGGAEGAEGAASSYAQARAPSLTVGLTGRRPGWSGRRAQAAVTSDELPDDGPGRRGPRCM